MATQSDKALAEAILWWHADTRRMYQREPEWVERGRNALKAAGVWNELIFPVAS